MTQQYSPSPKGVTFELVFPESPQFRARLPMRVQIFPHDSTESIISTVKNFYGLYSGHGGPGPGPGVSFENDEGITLIPKYENLANNSVVYVRVSSESFTSPGPYGPSSYHSGSAAQHHYVDDEQSLPQALTYGQPMSRPTSRTSRKRSPSPNSRGRRSTSVSTNPVTGKKSRSRSSYKSKPSSAHSSFQDLGSDGFNGYSSGNEGAGSVSGRSKSDYLPTTEISLDNIVEGGRRKRAKFESSELPLFAPPQMPAAASNSSVSPARRIEQRASIHFAHPNQYTHGQMQSPQSYHDALGQSGNYATPASGRRSRNGYSASINTPMTGSSILPTPDPTVGSCMSEEDKDVALQLMRLGEMSNISHGRTSASTLDETFSGLAEASSSTGATDDESESEDELPPARRQKLDESPAILPGGVKRFAKRLDEILPSQDSTEMSGDEADDDDNRDATFKPETQDESVPDSDVIRPKVNKPKVAPLNKPRPVNALKALKVVKTTKPTSSKPKVKAVGAPASKVPMSPTSLPSQSRKTSVSSAVNVPGREGEDTEDLSTKPRCQRCRKSKKGCDRQRPCQRCKDAGLSADQCVSEDESNGRKGRYGRHMGVPVKKDLTEIAAAPTLLPPTTFVGAMGSPDKNKKRKR